MDLSGKDIISLTASKICVLCNHKQNFLLVNINLMPQVQLPVDFMRW